MKYRVITSFLKGYNNGEDIPEGAYRELVDDFGAPESWFQPVEQVETGQYWKTGDSAFPFPDKEVLRIKETSSTHAYYQSITSNASGNGEKRYLERRARKLSTNEIEEALVKEAKRRGYVVGAKIKSLKDESVCEIEANNIIYNAKENLNPADTLFLNSWIIYQQGEWAEIIDQTPDIEINGKKIELKDEYISIGCETLSPEFVKELNCIMQKHNAIMYVYGEDITDKIKQIANYYNED